jgi:hypothetical protein
MELYDIFDINTFDITNFDIHDIVETNEPIYEINYKPHNEPCIKSRNKSESLKKYECSKCSKTFKSRSGYHNHLLTYKIENYECNICGKKFKYKTSLNNHTTRHQNIIYKCNICDKTYYNKRTLTSHKKTHKFYK